MIKNYIQVIKDHIACIFGETAVCPELNNNNNNNNNIIIIIIIIVIIIIIK